MIDCTDVPVVRPSTSLRMTAPHDKLSHLKSHISYLNLKPHLQSKRAAFPFFTFH